MFTDEAGVVYLIYAKEVEGGGRREEKEKRKKTKLACAVLFFSSRNPMASTGSPLTCGPFNSATVGHPGTQGLLRACYKTNTEWEQRWAIALWWRNFLTTG